jgi:bacterioferritin (cytochrome b1)
MQMTNPKVVASMQSPLRWERQIFSSVHDLEHLAEYARWHKLESYFNDLVAEARCRRRRLLRQIFAMGGTPDPDAGDPKAVPGPNDVEEMLSMAMSMYQSAWTEYQKAVNAAMAAGDQDTLSILSKNQREVRKTICKIEAKQRKVETMGPQVFRGTQA